MSERLLFPEFRKQHDPTRYPFSDRASLVNAAGKTILNGSFLDAALYPIGATGGLYLSSVVIDHEAMTFAVSDIANRNQLASGVSPLADSPDDVVLYDAFDRPAGLLVSEAARLAIFQSWGVGTHVFRPTESEFAATVCFPTPEIGLRGVRLETGEVFVGDVWLVGGAGVVLRREDGVLPEACSEGQVIDTIRVDIVGDPLFRRRLCTSSFVTPQFVTGFHIIGTDNEFDVRPNAHGEFQLLVNNVIAEDTALRITPAQGGVLIAVVGQKRVD